MTTAQKDAFLAGEGDAYFSRNPKTFEAASDPVMLALGGLQVAPKRILEIGCGYGARVSALAGRYGAVATGIDPSGEAVAHATRAHPGPAATFAVGTADRLAFDAASFDLVVLGFCLYLCDVADHFTIARECDRVLADGGMMVVYDFAPPAPFRNAYRHKPGVNCYKMAYAAMFDWHPSYRLVARSYFEHGATSTYAPNETVTVDVLRKDVASAFPENPWR